MQKLAVLRSRVQEARAFLHTCESGSSGSPSASADETTYLHSQAARALSTVESRHTARKKSFPGKSALLPGRPPNVEVVQRPQSQSTRAAVGVASLPMDVSGIAIKRTRACIMRHDTGPTEEDAAKEEVEEGAEEAKHSPVELDPFDQSGPATRLTRRSPSPQKGSLKNEQRG